MTRNDDKLTGSELGIIVAYGAAWFAIGLLCGLVLAPVVLGALA